MRSLRIHWALCVVLLPLTVSEARADLIDPAEEACGKAGDECELGDQKGVCKADTCSRLDYSDMGPDGTPGTKDYECVLCVPGAKAAEPAPEPTPDPAKKDEAKAEETPPQGGPEETKTTPEPTSTSKGTRCAVDHTSTSMLSFVLGLGLLGLATRRRR